MTRLLSGMILGAGLCLVALPARAQPVCGVRLNELNYDCALEAGTADDSCEFIELAFTGTIAGVKVNACGIAAIELVNGNPSSNCAVYPPGVRIDLPDVDIPADGLFVIGKAGVPNVDLTPDFPPWSDNSAGAIQNGGSDWIHFIGDTMPDQWYAYEFNPDAANALDCSAHFDGGRNGTLSVLGEDFDHNTLGDGGISTYDGGGPAPREESISWCNNAYLGEVAGVHSGPVSTPGAANNCDVLPWGTDGGTPVQDAGTRDTATADRTSQDTGSPQVDSGTPPVDAGTRDTAAGQDRAATDTGSSATDSGGGAEPGDGDDTADDEAEGCGCAGARLGASWALAALLAAAWALRRRRARA